jgi:hypothetical protein
LGQQQPCRFQPIGFFHQFREREQRQCRCDRIQTVPNLHLGAHQINDALRAGVSDNLHLAALPQVGVGENNVPIFVPNGL